MIMSTFTPTFASAPKISAAERVRMFGALLKNRALITLAAGSAWNDADSTMPDIALPSERSLHQVTSYLHCNPATIIDPKWKNGPVVDPQFLGEHIAAYPYSSLGTYTGNTSYLSPILDPEVRTLARSLPVQKLLQEARSYCADSPTIP